MKTLEELKGFRVLSIEEAKGVKGGGFYSTRPSWWYGWPINRPGVSRSVSGFHVPRGTFSSIGGYRHR